LDLAVVQTVDSNWQSRGPLGYSAVALRLILVRLLWCALHPDRGLRGMPQGWFDGQYGQVITIPCHCKPWLDFQDAEARLNRLFSGHGDEFKEWICARAANQTHPFEISVRASDLETLTEWSVKFEALRSRDH
jgi:hypothetical protein